MSPQPVTADTFTCTDIHVDNDSHMLFAQWADGHQSKIPITRLRGYCPCADCQGHGGLVRWIDNRCGSILGAELVGRYAVNLAFGDGHRTGIFRWETIRKLDPAEEGRWGRPEDALRNAVLADMEAAH